jgi:hypothetical protein
MVRTFACGAASFLTTGVALAHPGHGTTEGDTAAHYLLEPVHGLPLLLLAGAVAVSWTVFRGVRRRR